MVGCKDCEGEMFLVWGCFWGDKGVWACLVRVEVLDAAGMQASSGIASECIIAGE